MFDFKGHEMRGAVLNHRQRGRNLLMENDLVGARVETGRLKPVHGTRLSAFAETSSDRVTSRHHWFIKNLLTIVLRVRALDSVPFRNPSVDFTDGVRDAPRFGPVSARARPTAYGPAHGLGAGARAPGWWQPLRAMGARRRFPRPIRGGGQKPRKPVAIPTAKLH